MGKHAGLAHVRDLGNRAYAQSFQTDLGGQAKSRLNDRGLGLLAFLHGTDYGLTG